MMRSTSRLRAAGLLLATALATTLLPTAAHAAGTLTIASTLDPGSWDPDDTFLVAWAQVATNIFNGLTYRGPDMKLVPGLATSWEELDAGKRLRFHLRTGVTFQDGEPFNAAAVKYTFDRLLGPAGAKSPQRDNYSNIDHVDVIDDNTVDFFLKQPDPVLPTKLAGYGGMIVPPRYIEEKGEDYFNTHPIGTGPFKVVDYQPKVSVTLEANPNYWDGKPKLDKLVYRFINEPATEVAELQAGRVDIVPDLPVSQIPVVQGDKTLSIATSPGPLVEALFFNTKSGITQDINVRKALIMAVDRTTIVNQLLNGAAVPINSFQSAMSFGFDPSLKGLPYDPEQAKKLLAEAKVPAGATLELSVLGNDPTFNEVAQAVASYLQAVGLNPTIKPYETSVFYNDIIPHGKTGAMYQFGWGGWTFDYDNTAYLIYHTKQFYNPYQGSPELDKLLETQRPMTDKAKREEILKQIAKYVSDQAWEMDLYNPKAVYGMSNRVQGFVPAPDDRMLLTDVSVKE
ncbi:MAG TPA: ABC transporter substrate-binding protein [Devosiaceae bacterium]|nr:ABC transporter substrate-binding protein [Devosiaceae bacterium]